MDYFEKKSLSFVFAIATYRRENDLKRLISSIDCATQICEENIKVSLNIRDNDNKSKNNIINLKSLSKYCKIFYTKNTFNEGGRINVWKVLRDSIKYGDYVISISDDDYILPDFLNILIKYLRSNNYDYLISNFFSQNFDITAKKLQHGLESPFLQGIISYKSDTIISNRILTGTCFSSDLIKRVITSIDENIYLEQFYPCQFIGCFSRNCLRINERISVHQVGNEVFWEDFQIYKDIVINRLKGYMKAFEYQGNKNDLEILLLKTILNYPTWVGLRIIFTRNPITLVIRLKYLILKIFHMKIISDAKRLVSFWMKNLK